MRHQWRQLILSAAAIISVGAANAAAWQLEINLASASVLNLLVVVLIARSFGIVVASAASVAAVVSMDFLLIPPLYVFTVDDPRNWVALGAFEACALLVARLSTQAELHSKLAVRERADSQRLYEVSRQMLLFDRERVAGPQIVDLIQRVYLPEATVLFEDGAMRAYRSPDAEHASFEEMEDSARSTYFSGEDSFDPLTCTWYCVVRLGARAMGSLGMRGGDISRAAMDSLASLAAIALERERALNAESLAIAERHTEQLRAAVLDALAHEFKTPLTTIRTASGGLIEMNRLPAQERELANLIDEATVRLTDLTTKALRTAKLDAGDAAPHRVRMELGEVVDGLLRAADHAAGHEFVRVVKNGSAHLLADCEMLNLGLGQLVDNAIRYSTPGSPITLAARADEYEVRISVKNLGEVIPMNERSKIFERYYRIPGTSHRANGTGLGLSVAKRIVEAHHGRLWVESENAETTFVALLPRDRRNE
jgi:two-component system, OmpR family, sensor histidine kinase KdpD